MTTRLQSLRNRAFEEQQGRCYYCDLPMWCESLQEFASEHGMSIRKAARFRCTAEHLVARREGGRNTKCNVVAACWHCNSTRHKRKEPPAQEQWKLLQRRRAWRRWHPEKIRALNDLAGATPRECVTRSAGI